MPISSRRRFAPLCIVIALVALATSACGDDKEPSAGGTTTQVEGGAGDEDAVPNTLSIDMKDYNYSISGELTAGSANLAFTNSGAELHMAAFMKLAEGKTLADVQTALQSQDEAAAGAVIEKQLGSPGALLGPGQKQETGTDALEAGTYAVICFLPTAGEAEPVPHFAKGMVSSFQVKAGSADLAAPEPDAQFAIEKGKNDGPEELKAGETIIKATAGADGPHEFFVMKKSSPDVTYDDVDKFFTDLFESDKAPPAGYAQQAPATVVASSFDIEPGESVFLTVDLEPGRYLVGCALEPDESAGASAQPHKGEVLEVAVT